MPYYRRRYGYRRGGRGSYRGRKYTNTYQRKFFSGGYARKYVTSYGGKTFRQLGMRRAGPNVSYNQVFRVGFTPQLDQGVVSAGNTSSNNAEVIRQTIDPLYVLMSDARWGTDVAARFASIIVKGFSVTRLIQAVNAIENAQYVQSLTIAYRWDRKAGYHVNNNSDYGGLMQFQDTKIKMISAEEGGSFSGKQIVSKIHALPGQYFMLDTSTAPGTIPNLDYWDAQFMMGCCSGTTVGYNLSWQDVVEMQYDGYEQRQ